MKRYLLEYYYDTGETGSEIVTRDDAPPPFKEGRTRDVYARDVTNWTDAEIDAYQAVVAGA